MTDEQESLEAERKAAFDEWAAEIELYGDVTLASLGFEAGYKRAAAVRGEAEARIADLEAAARSVVDAAFESEERHSGGGRYFTEIGPARVGRKTVSGYELIERLRALLAAPDAPLEDE